MFRPYLIVQLLIASIDSDDGLLPNRLHQLSQPMVTQFIATYMRYSASSYSCK